MKYLKTIISLIAVILILTACDKDFLDRPPLDQVTAAGYFKSPSDLSTYVNQFYNDSLFYNTLPAPFYNANSFASDNRITDNVDKRLEGSRSFSTVKAISFGLVRSINYFFDHYKNVEEENKLEDYQQYLGEAYFFRALIYFNLLRKYGDVVWVTTEVSTTSPDLYKPRDPRNFVADNIIAQLDSAAKYLTEDKTDGASRINKWMALLIQSRVALYEGSWEKYHDGDPFGVSDPQPEKYFNKVVEATTAIMNSGLYDIYSTGDAMSDYNDLFALRDYSSNEEVMFWRKFDAGLEKTNEVLYRKETPNGQSITKELADAYLCTDGKSIAGNSLFGGYTTLSEEMQNRDPRFFQTIATPDSPWKIHEDGTVQNWSELYEKLNSSSDYKSPTGYVIRKGYNPELKYHVVKFEETPLVYYRYAEVLLNYAEAKAELGTITQSDIDMSIKKLRDRVGMPNLVLSSIATDPNWNFPALSPTINEIRRERRIELALEGFRWDDIARWAAADELIIGKRPSGFIAAQVPKNRYFPVDDDGFLDPFQDAIPNGYQFILGRDYLDGISLLDITLNPLLEQNPGWEQ